MVHHDTQRASTAPAATHRRAVQVQTYTGQCLTRSSGVGLFGGRIHESVKYIRNNHGQRCTFIDRVDMRHALEIPKLAVRVRPATAGERRITTIVPPHDAHGALDYPPPAFLYVGYSASR